MPVRRTLILSLAAAAALMAAAPATRADLIVNGGFEEPAIDRGFITYSAGDPSLAPWVITSGSVDIVREFWPAYEGDQSLDLNGLESGTIQQAFATTAGETYTLSFAYANHYNVPEASATVSVLGGGSLFSQDIVHSGSTFADMMWTVFTADFVADSAITTLVFRDTSSTPTVGFALDAVSVSPTAVPEPSSLVLGALGIIGGLGFRRSRRLLGGIGVLAGLGGVWRRRNRLA